MTVVTIELPDLIALGMKERAHQMNVPLEAVYAEALAAVAVGAAHAGDYQGVVHERVAHMVVVDHMCDADIASKMGVPPGNIARIRRSMGLPPNKRRWS